MNHGDLTIERQSVTPATLMIHSSTAVVPAHNAAQQTGGVYRGATPETIAQHEAAGADPAGETGVMRLRPYG
jgi:hypothetical protein